MNMLQLLRFTDNLIASVIQNITSHRPVVFLIILTIAVLLRFQLFGNNFIFSDIGRDMLVARHLAHGWTNANDIKPNSTFVVLPQTSLYYRLLALFYTAIPDPISINIAHAVISLSILIAAYKFGCILGNQFTGVMSGLALATSPMIVMYARGVSQFSLVPVCSMYAIYYLFKSLNSPKEKGTVTLIMSIVWFTPALLLHHVSIALWPSFLIVWLVYILFLNRNPVYKVVLFTMILGQVMLFLFAIQPEQNFVAEVRLAFVNFAPQQYMTDRIQSVILLISSLLNIKLELLFSIIFWLGTSIYNKKISKNILLLYIVLLCSLIISLLLPFSIFHIHYLTPAFLLIPLLFVANTWSASGPYTRILSVILSIIFFYNSTTLSMVKSQSPLQYSYLENQEIASAIYNKSTFITKQLPFTIILPLVDQQGLPKISDWFSGSIWYSLEIISGKRMVDIVPSTINPNNIVIQDSEDRFILVCVNDPKSSFYRIDNCLTDWNSIYAAPLRQIEKLSFATVDYYIFETE